MATVTDKLRHIMAEILEVDANLIHPETDFLDDLGGDSMMTLEAVVVIEKEFGIEMPESRLAEGRTFGGLENLVRECLGEEAPVAGVS